MIRNTRTRTLVTLATGVLLASCGQVAEQAQQVAEQAKQVEVKWQVIWEH
jgi:hypothetical protein